MNDPAPLLAAGFPALGSALGGMLLTAAIAAVFQSTAVAGLVAKRVSSRRAILLGAATWPVWCYLNWAILEWCVR